MKIWFNHWFSTAYHLIRLMGEGLDEKPTFIGSNSQSVSAYRQVCDEWYLERELPPREYVEFCLDFCRSHAVDVFVPRRGLVDISAASALFEATGVKLLSEPSGELTRLLDDKVSTYQYFEHHMPEIVPAYRLVNSLEDFKTACSALSDYPGRLCYKLCNDEGAKSFRVLDDSIESLKAIYEKPGTKVTYRAAEAILSQYDFSIPMIVMPYLSGADVSVDCLDTDSGRIMLPRFKVGRYNEVRPDSKIMEICSEIMDLLMPHMPINIQFKLEKEIPYLLEINPRMSGGLQLSWSATGINIPALALRKLLGKSTKWNYPEHWATTGVVNLETPVIVYKEEMKPHDVHRE